MNMGDIWTLYVANNLSDELITLMQNKKYLFSNEYLEDANIVVDECLEDAKIALDECLEDAKLAVANDISRGRPLGWNFCWAILHRIKKECVHQQRNGRNSFLTIHHRNRISDYAKSVAQKQSKDIIDGAIAKITYNWTEAIDTMLRNWSDSRPVYRVIWVLTSRSSESLWVYNIPRWWIESV